MCLYCVKCGVELADSEKKCPLCGVTVWCPKEMRREMVLPPYPKQEIKAEKVKRTGLLFVLTVLFSLPFVLTLLCDWRINGVITWGGYASGAILLLYIAAVLPIWFEKPNPVIFVPVDFVAVGVYLFYIDYTVNGQWFWTFALPVTGGCMLITTAVVTLMRYVPKGGLYIFGGAFLASGGLMILTEYLIDITFKREILWIWSIYPFAAFSILGLALILIAICKPLRDSLGKKFFV
jgi:hypothetical protein